MSLGESIRLLRQKALYTQEEFARELNVALSTVNRWELGKAKPNIKAMKQIKCFCKGKEFEFKNIEDDWLNQSKETKNECCKTDDRR